MRLAIDARPPGVKLKMAEGLLSFRHFLVG
jgi:hypothetical protein